MNSIKENEMKDLSEILKKVLVKIKKITDSYNFYIHYAPKGTSLHFHIEIAPRLATWAGFEFSTDFTINSIIPEEAAKFYRN